MLSCLSEARASCGTSATSSQVNSAASSERFMEPLALRSAWTDEGPRRRIAARLARHLDDDGRIEGECLFECELKLGRAASPETDDAKTLGEPYKVRIHKRLADEVSAE